MNKEKTGEMIRSARTQQGLTQNELGAGTAGGYKQGNQQVGKRRILPGCGCAGATVCYT